MEICLTSGFKAGRLHGSLREVQLSLSMLGWETQGFAILLLPIEPECFSHEVQHLFCHKAVSWRLPTLPSASAEIEQEAADANLTAMYGIVLRWLSTYSVYLYVHIHGSLYHGSG